MATFDQVISRILEQEMPDEKHEFIGTFQESISFWANKNLILTRHWIIDTDLMLDRELEETDVSNFYIKLHGIVNEMFEHYKKRSEILKEVLKQNDIAPLVDSIKQMISDYHMRNFLELSITAFELLSKIRNEFNELELKKILFFRHKFCHPMLTKLSVKIDKKKFTQIKKDKTMREIAESDKSDELDSMKIFYRKLKLRRTEIKELEKILQSMQFK